MPTKIKSNPKVLLVNPFSKRYPWELKRTGQPLVLTVIATYLTKVLGIETSILDATAEGFENEVHSFNGRISYGLKPREFQQRVSLEAPDIVLMSGQFTCQYTNLVESAKLIKKMDRKILIGVGGLHTASLPEEVLSNENIDFVFLNEENTLGDFFLALGGKKELSNIKSFGYKRDGFLFINKARQYVRNLGHIPIYSLDFLNEDLYKKNVFHNGYTDKKFLDIITERGCPNKCYFCATGNRPVPFRRYRLEQIETLLKAARARGYELILNEDDNGFHSKQRITNLMKLYQRYNFRWQQVHGIGPNQINLELLNIMKQSGCEKIYLAVENAQKSFRLKELGKPASVSGFEFRELLNKLEMLIQYGIKVDVGFIIGHPMQTLEDIKEEIDFGKRIKQAGPNFVMPWIFTLLPGTPSWEALGKFKVGTYDDCNLMTGNIATTHFTPEILRSVQQEAIERINEISFRQQFLLFGWDSRGKSPQP